MEYSNSKLIRILCMLCAVVSLIIFQSGCPFESGTDITIGENEFIIQNDAIKCTIQKSNMEMKILNKKNGKEYAVGQSQFQVSSANAQNDQLVMHCNSTSGVLSAAVIMLKLNNNAIQFDVEADNTASINYRFAFPGEISASEDTQYLIVPYAAGLIIPSGNPNPFYDHNNWEFMLWKHKTSMPFVGVTNLNSGFMVTSDSPWDTSLEFIKHSGSNNSVLRIHHYGSKGEFAYARRFHITLINDDGYVEMAKWYRNHAEELGLVETLQAKKNKNPNVDRLIGAGDFWMPNDMNGVSSVENLISQGVTKAIISLPSRLYIYYPEITSDTINYINSNNLLSSRYDVYSDVWPTEYEEYGLNTFGYPQNVIIDADGSYQKGWIKYGVGPDNEAAQGYRICASRYIEDAQTRTAVELSNYQYNCRFIDTITSLTLTECFSQDHPMTRVDDIINRAELLKYLKEDFNMVLGTEESKDETFKYIEYSEGAMTIEPAEGAGYDWRTPTDNPGEKYYSLNMNPAIRIPLLALVYHDCHVSTWYTGDGVSKVPDSWRDKDLFTMLYGAMQLFAPVSEGHWQSDQQRFIDSYNITSNVFKEVGYAKMDSHQFLDSNWLVQRTTFSNGWEVVVNFSNSSYVYNGRTIEAKGYYTSRK